LCIVTRTYTLYVNCLSTPNFSISPHLVIRFTAHSLQFADNCLRLVGVDFHTVEFKHCPSSSALHSTRRAPVLVFRVPVLYRRAPALTPPPFHALIPIRAPVLLVRFRTTWSLSSYNPLVGTIYQVDVGILPLPDPQHYIVL